MRYTVKQVAALAGVTVRTLHYYDEIGLLVPTSHGENGYRYYGEEALLRLQQIMFFRELDFSLAEIQRIMGSPDFDLLHALREHRQALHQRIEKLSRLISTVDQTIHYLKGETEMEQKGLFTGFTEEQEQAYTEEASQRYGRETVAKSAARWKRYTAEEKAAIGTEGQQIYLDLVAAMPEGHTSPTVQAIIGRWYRFMNYFYEPTPAHAQGLAQLYVESPDFAAFFRKIHPELPEFLSQAILYFYEQNFAAAPHSR